MLCLLSCFVQHDSMLMDSQAAGTFVTVLMVDPPAVRTSLLAYNYIYVVRHTIK